MKHSYRIPELEPVAAVAVAGQSFSTDDLALDAQRGKAVERARVFAEPLLASETLDTGENTFAHAQAVAAILQSIGGSEAMQAASYLVYACEHLNKPQDIITKAFGESYATLALETTRLVHIQRQARAASLQTTVSPGAASQTENIRKMLLAFSRDLRVVMLRLASRLQTLRYYAASKTPVPHAVASEALHVFAPLANRLGIWQIKWEMEDLAFRFLEPETYKSVAKQLQDKRIEREEGMARLREQLELDLKAQGIVAQVQGRPKHIYSIVKKMRGKQLSFEQVLDVRALRVIVSDGHNASGACYAALSRVHELFEPMAGEFDDYIAKPKSNGYQSLHTVVRDDTLRPLEIQIRTQAMHQHAETGVAAHWAYKEAGTKGYAGVSASGSYDAKIAVLRQLLAWQQELAEERGGDAQLSQVLDDRIYVLTPEAAIVDLPRGATPVDFAYALHTNLGHRCRGARVNGQLVTLNTPLENGQTVEIQAAKEGGPSRDWLNPELHYLASPRARAKVRAWFNALQLQETISQGRQAVEKLLQREGKTALKLDDLAAQLGFKTAEDLFEVVGKDEFSLRTIEQYLRPAAPTVVNDDEQVLLRTTRVAEKLLPTKSAGSVLVVGVDSLLTQLSKCCKPAPPDAIVGYVTRGKGVSIHRAGCTTLQKLIEKEGERLVDVAWGAPKSGAAYAVDVRVVGSERSTLLRDVSEVFSKEKVPVRSVQQHVAQGSSWITLTVVVQDGAQLTKVLAGVAQVPGVERARRI